MLAALRHALHERFVAWALRVRPPEPVPVVLVQRRVYVLPTRAGLLYALALLVMLIGAINYNLGLGHVLVFLLAALGIVTMLHTFRNLVRLSVATGATAPVFAGETACFPLLLHNPDPRPRRLIRLSLPDQPDTLAELPANGQVRILLPLPATRRGWLTMPRITLETVWPLGLVRTWGYAHPGLACLVYPRPADAAPPPPALLAHLARKPGSLPPTGGASAWGGPAPTCAEQQGGRLPGNAGDEDFAGLRRHQPGDPPHHVAWKAAARLGHAAPLQTKQFAGNAAPSPWFDWNSLPPGMATETRLSILARWVLDAEADGLAWGLRLPGGELAPAAGPAHLHACLKALALHES